MKVWERAVKRAPLSALTEYTHPRGEVLSLVCCALHAYPVWVVLLSQTVCGSAVQVRSSLRKNKEQRRASRPANELSFRRRAGGSAGSPVSEQKSRVWRSVSDGPDHGFFSLSLHRFVLTAPTAHICYIF